MSRVAILAALFASLVCFDGASAAERKAYKYVDEKGNVTYSQTPPADKDAKTVDVSPAHQGRGGYSPGRPSYPQGSNYADQRQAAQREQERQREQAKQKRIAELEAQCTRNRGTDCKNPETLRYMEAQNIPGGRNTVGGR